MSGTISAKKVVAHPYFALLVFLLVILLLPRFGGVAVMLGCASLFSALLAVLPEQFRNRTGSISTAIYLAAALWLGAVIITVLVLSGVLRN